MKLKTLRKEKGLTQQDVANAIGVSQVTYSRYENGEHEPSHDILIALSVFFGVTIDELLGINEPEKEFSELDEFNQFKKRMMANSDYCQLMKKAERSSPQHIRAAIAVLDALDPMA